MSADDFQIKYASVMESMLKSAVAETTKLFETMVDELKAEISRIKKENEDLKTRCSQFENAKSQPAVHSGGSAPLPGTSDAFDKRDRAVQCDLVPIRTMLVEQCQPFRDSSLQNQEQQWRYEKIEYSLPEYNCVIHREAESQMANVEVKQEDDDSCLESVLKQEQDEPTVTCRQVVSDNAGSSLTFTCGTEGPCINQECLSGEIPLPRKNEETTKALDLLCLRMESSLQGVQNRSSEPQHSLVISLAAIKDDLEEESEISLKTSEIGTQAELKTSDEHKLIVAQHQSEVESLENEPRDGEISVNEQADITLEQNGDVHCTVEQLAETTAQNKEVSNEQLKTGMAEGEPSSQPVHRKRGRPPKRAKNSQQRVRKDLQLSSTVVTKEHEMVTSLITVEEVEVSSTDTVNATASGSPKTSQINSKKTSSIIAPSAQESINTALKDVDNRKVVSVVPLSRTRSAKKGEPSESQHLFTEMEKASNQAPSNEVSFATETLNTPPAGSPQAPAHHHKQRRTSAMLQDAMLLVEAMNQSTVENAFNSPKKVVAPPQSQRAPFVRTLQTVDEIPAKPQKPLLPLVAHEVAGKLPVTEVSTSTVDTLNVTPQSTDAAPNDKDQTHRTVIISSQQHVVTHPSTTASPAPLSSAAPQTSVSSKTIYVTSGKLLPVVPSQSSVISRDQQSGTLAQPKIIIIPTQPQSQTILLATKQDSAKSDSPVIVASPQLCSTSQDLRVSLDAQATLDEVAASLSQKRDNISDDLESPKQTMSVPEITNAPTGNSSSLKRSVGKVPASVFPVVQPALEQKLSAMVRLTRLPLPVSTTESVFVSRMLSNGSLNETWSTLKDCTTQRKPSSMVMLTQPSEMPVTNIRPNFKESSVALCINNSQMSEEPNIVQNKALAFSETSTVMEESQESSYVQPSTSYKMSAVATSTTEPLADEPLSNLNEQIISNTVQNCALQNDPTIGENQAASLIQLTAITPRDTTDPHLQMTKTQFLAQLAVSPIVQAPEKASTGDFADATVCGKERFQMNSLVVRLRSHLKTHCQTKRAESNSEQCIETEITTVSSEKLKLEKDNPKDKNISEPIPVSAKSQIVLEDVPSVNETTNDPGPISPRKSDNEPTTVSSRKSNVTGESPPVRRSSGRDRVGSKNKQPSSVSPRRSSSTKDGTNPINTKSTCVISMKTSTSRDGASTRNTKSTSVSPKRSTSEGAVPKDTIAVCASPKRTITSGAVTTPNSRKSTCVSPKTTNTSRSGISPKNTKSTLVTEEDKTSRNGVSPPKNKSTSVSPRMDRSLALTKSGTKQIKRESNYLSPGRCSVTTDGASTKKAKCETASPRAGLAKAGDNPKRTGKSTPAKKPRLNQDGTGLKKNLKVVNAKKLAKAAKAKTITKMKISKQILKLQNGAKTSQLAENQANCEVVKKCTTKAVWIPPRIPVTKTPTKETRSIDHAAIYTPSVSFHPILVKGPPIVSPLQPLSVIGGRLLKNQCGECGRILSSSAALESHVGLHTGRRPFSCTLCGKSFPDSKGLKRHGRVHRNGRIHVCPQCGKGFVYRFGLTKHLQMVHGRLKPFVCQICNKGFYAKRDVEAHIRIHTGEKPFHCNLCEKKFTRRVELNVHLRWHNGEKRHWCPFCGKGFLDFNNLKRHKYIHTGEKPHSCPHCPKNFTQSGHLKKHVKNVHKIQ